MGDNVGYVTFGVSHCLLSSHCRLTHTPVLFARHCTEKTQDNTINLVHTFRNYLHYHIKCSKGYLHSRMRAKTTGFLQVRGRGNRHVMLTRLRF